MTSCAGREKPGRTPDGQAPSRSLPNVEVRKGLTMPQSSACHRLLTCSLVALLVLIAPYGIWALAAKTSALTPMVLVPAGPFIMGSTPEEREYGYRLDEQRGSSVARGNRWFEHETRASRKLDAYLIDVYPVTNADYKTFVDAIG